jgi:hypothetical protein
MLTDMPDETETLLRRLISGDQAAVAAVLAGATRHSQRHTPFTH